MSSDSTIDRETLSGRSAFVTGAGSGIGRATALALSAKGARVAILDVSEKTAHETLELMGKSASGSAALTLDVSNPSGVDSVFAKAADEIGPPDILINSAGIRDLGPFLDLSLDDWQRVLDVNLTGLFRCSQIVARSLVDRGQSGCIIHVTSVAGLTGVADRAAYVASKHAVVGLTKEMALELGPHAIRVNAVAPGPVLTNLTRPLLEKPGAVERVKASQPLGRWGEASEVADLILFLASNEAAFITGETVTIDGGFMAGKFG